MAELKNGMLDFDVPSPEITGIWSLFKESFRFYIANFLLIAGIIVVVKLPLDALAAFLKSLYRTDTIGSFFQINDLPSFALHLLQTAVGAFVSATLIYLLIGLLKSGKRPSLSESFSWRFKRFPRVFLVHVLYSLAVLGGFLLLIVPGIIFAVYYCFVEIIACLEVEKRPSLFRRSEELAKANWKLILFSGLIVLGFSAALFLGFSLVWNYWGLKGGVLFETVIRFIDYLFVGYGSVITLFIFLHAVKKQPDVMFTNYKELEKEKDATSSSKLIQGKNEE